MEQTSSRVEYAEVFDFPTYTAYVAEKHRHILEDDSLDPNTKHETIAALLDEANSFMDRSDIRLLGADTIVGPEALLGFSDDGEALRSTEHIFGWYDGFETIEHVDEEGNFNSHLFHRVNLGTETFSSPFTESEETRYAFLPVESGDILILNPPLATQSNENWLKSLFRPFMEGQLDPKDIEAVYERIVHARSKFNAQKNIDWVIDRLNFIVGSDKYIAEVVTTEFFLTIIDDVEAWKNDTTNTEVHMETVSGRLEGMILGFCTMRDYMREETEHEEEFVNYIDGQDILALALDVSSATETRIARVPLRTCNSIEIQGSV